jgi:hypothetical protein
MEEQQLNLHLHFHIDLPLTKKEKQKINKPMKKRKGYATKITRYIKLGRSHRPQSK